ncbi:MAG TPA: endo-1,3-alpha-glucanase family glycosylhydrolase [Anaerolineae bacterium]|nr:endo-1,3-alpha-glucanase family glycosylhydrolase [Anaerolineae bacterium]
MERHFRHKALRVGITLLVGVSFLVFAMLLLRANSIVQATGIKSSQTIGSQVSDIANPACEMTSTVLAAYQVWHGLTQTHQQPPPYLSIDPDVISRHIRSAQAQCIDGFVVDWYGPPTGLPNDERGYMDQATAELLRQSADRGFKVALMYDEGALSSVTANTTTRVISDLLYARQYFTLSSYLTISGRPALFIFPYDNVDPHIDWSTVRQQLGISFTLLDKDPDPNQLAHDALFDGFYAWVYSPSWPTSTLDWGEDYLKWFYPAMKTSPYVTKTVVGGVWPGFDDSGAAWGQGRYISRRCGATWLDTWNLAKQYQPPLVLIGTWNDFEEGTDIEYGILPKPAWQEDFDPIQRTWMTPTARWEDVPGPTAILRENNPAESFGKVESEVITANVDLYPLLRVNVTAVDADASYTVQILDKRTDIATDVLKEITAPGRHIVNLAQQMGWQGPQSFTLNIWIGGEGKTATFDRVSIEACYYIYLPAVIR